MSEVNERRNSSALYARFDAIADQYARVSFDVDLRPEQRRAITHILLMAKDKEGFYPSAHLLIQKTGAGKSLARNMAGRMLNGITWTLSPLLSLSGDQVESTKKYIDNSNDDRYMKSYNLDTVRTNKDV